MWLQEALMELNRQLVEASSKESLLQNQPDRIARVTVDRLEIQAQNFKFVT